MVGWDGCRACRQACLQTDIWGKEHMYANRLQLRVLFGQGRRYRRSSQYASMTQHMYIYHVINLIICSFSYFIICRVIIIIIAFNISFIWCQVWVPRGRTLEFPYQESMWALFIILHSLYVYLLLTSIFTCGKENELKRMSYRHRYSRENKKT